MFYFEEFKCLIHDLFPKKGKKKSWLYIVPWFCDYMTSLFNLLQYNLALLQDAYLPNDATSPL